VPAALPGRARHPFHRRRLRYDPTFHTLAGYAEERGLPYSSLFEDPWTDEDRAILLAVKLEKAQVCPMCGTPEWEHEENPGSYEAAVRVCPGCALKDNKRSESDDKLPPGAHIQLIPADVAERLRQTPRRRPRSARERARIGRGLR
jgi:hypothetical protein